jgi:glutathione S-transferase
MNLVLYYAPVACSLVPYVTLTEAGAPFEVRPVNMGKRQQMSADYLKVNPKHKVPVLVIDGEPLSENVAIQQWIHRNYPAAKLLPADAMEELKAISLMAWCASGIHPYLGIINTPARVCDVAGSEESVKRLSAGLVYETFKIADDLLDGRDWFFDHFTAADAHFFWCIRRGTQLKLELAPYKNCLAHFERMQKRPSVQKVLAFEKETQEAFAKAA